MSKKKVRSFSYIKTDSTHTGVTKSDMRHCTAASDSERACVHLLYNNPASCQTRFVSISSRWLLNRQTAGSPQPGSLLHLFARLQGHRAAARQIHSEQANEMIGLCRPIFFNIRPNEQNSYYRVWTKGNVLSFLSFKENPGPGLALMMVKLTQSQTGYYT